MCVPQTGWPGKGPGWGKGGGWILEGTKTPLSMNRVGLNEPVISQSWGRGVKRWRGSCHCEPGPAETVKIKDLDEQSLYSPILNKVISYVVLGTCHELKQESANHGPDP